MAAGDDYQQVVMEWDTIPGATEYILEIQNKSGKILKVSKSKNSTFRFRMPVGSYQIRGRVTGDDGVESPWSDLSELIVPPMPPAKINAEKPIKATVLKDSLKAKVALEWNQVPAVKQYRVQILTEDKKVAFEKIVTTPATEIVLPPGRYSYQVSSISAEGIESSPQLMEQVIDVSPIKLKAVILPETVANHKIELPRSELLELQVVGTLEYLKHFDEKWEIVNERLPIKDQFSTEGLMPGRYKLSVWSELKGYLNSDKKSIEFVVKPTEEKLKKLLGEL